MCLGEKRRLLIPEKELKNKYKEVGFSLRFFYRTILFPGITRHPWYSPDVPWGRTHRHQQNVLAKVRFHLLFNCSNNCDHNVPAEFHKSYQIWIWSYAVNVGACRPWILWEDGWRWWHSCCGVWGQVQCSSYNLMCKVAACMCNHWFQPGGWNCIWLICIPRSTIWWKIKLLLW